jgi:hypothetical protein
MDDDVPAGQDHRVVMSFLDVMSSGLGAAILLFIVFRIADSITSRFPAQAV